MERLSWQMSASDLADAIREKKTTSQEVVQAHFDRIEAVNHRVNAITVVLREEALQSAQEADRKIAKGEQIGQLQGVPITIKENIDVYGSATTMGVVALKDANPTVDAPIVSLLKKAGAIPIGRTNLPDFALRDHTNSSLNGVTINPWKQTCTPGGSSGGEAVAIATGMSPLGIGNDFAGSVRYPSQCCGIAAIRPTFGRVSRKTTAMETTPMFSAQFMAVNGPMARHIRDLRLALNVMSAPDPSDPHWVPALRLGNSVSHPIKIALTIDSTNQRICPIIESSIRKAADILSNAGYIIEEVNPPSVEKAIELFIQLVDMESQLLLPFIRPIISEEAQTFLDIKTAGDTKPDLTTYMNTIAERYNLASEWNLFQEKYPLILGPVTTMQPFEVGYDIAGSEQKNKFIRSKDLAMVANFLGLPSVVTPVQVVNGLPQSIQIIGARYHEDLCFDAAEEVEQKLGVFTPIDPLGT